MDEVIKKQILDVRATGAANMFDIITVQYIACQRGYYELVIYLEEHRKEYADFILRGDTG